MATELSASTVCQLFASAPVKLLKRALAWISQFAQTFQFVKASVAQNGSGGRAVERLTPTIGEIGHDRDRVSAQGFGFGVGNAQKLMFSQGAGEMFDCLGIFEYTVRNGIEKIPFSDFVILEL